MATQREIENELLRNFINNGADINLPSSRFGFHGVGIENLSGQAPSSPGTQEIGSNKSFQSNIAAQYMLKLKYPHPTNLNVSNFVTFTLT